MNHLEKHFGRIGARVAVEEPGASLDVRTDRAGEYFVVGADQRILDTRPAMRHLLLMNGESSKFLCGHDERHFFVAAIPERVLGVRDVLTAMEALKPRAVRFEVERRNLKSKHRNRRRNAAFLRQGEWFFLPHPRFAPPASQVLRNEPLRRDDGSKPHTVESCYREGGERVYVSLRFPNGVTESRYQLLLRQRPALRRLNWQVQRRNPLVYAKGRIRHADHKTIRLDCWHQVIMNRETESVAMRHVAFID